MSSVLCNMKGVSITFLPYSPVKNRAQVVQTPPYTFIHYATPSNSCFFLSLANTILASQHTRNKYCIDITFYLTNLHQYILRGNSHREYTLHTTMWTTTTSTTSSKKHFQTLNTPLINPSWAFTQSSDRYRYQATKDFFKKHHYSSITKPPCKN